MKTWWISIPDLAFSKSCITFINCGSDINIKHVSHNNLRIILLKAPTIRCLYQGCMSVLVKILSHSNRFIVNVFFLYNFVCLLDENLSKQFSNKDWRTWIIFFHNPKRSSSYFFLFLCIKTLGRYLYNVLQANTNDAE